MRKENCFLFFHVHCFFCQESIVYQKDDELFEIFLIIEVVIFFGSSNAPESHDDRPLCVTFVTFSYISTSLWKIDSPKAES